MGNQSPGDVQIPETWGAYWSVHFWWCINPFPHVPTPEALNSEIDRLIRPSTTQCSFNFCEATCKQLWSAIADLACLNANNSDNSSWLLKRCCLKPPLLAAKRVPTHQTRTAKMSQFPGFKTGIDSSHSNAFLCRFLRHFLSEFRIIVLWSWSLFYQGVQRIYIYIKYTIVSQVSMRTASPISCC